MIRVWLSSKLLTSLITQNELGRRMPRPVHRLDECLRVVATSSMLELDVRVRNLHEHIAGSQIGCPRVAHTAEIDDDDRANPPHQRLMRMADEHDVRVAARDQLADLRVAGTR